jgi:quercetin dioxygenase-like cupin family protein
VAAEDARGNRGTNHDNPDDRRAANLARVRTHPMGMSQTIVRKPLLKALLGDHNVNAVDIREIRFAPGQKTTRHLHPCTVVGYIAEGSAVLEIEGQPAQTLPTGSAFHEPAGTVIADFRNASETNPMTFIAFYLLDGDEDLITMLNSA